MGSNLANDCHFPEKIVRFGLFGVCLQRFHRFSTEVAQHYYVTLTADDLGKMMGEVYKQALTKSN
jgi:hypothetical protein